MKAPKWTITFVVLDIMLGFVLLSFFDPIVFAEKYSVYIYGGLLIAWLLWRAIVKYKSLHFTERANIQIQFVEA